jgi:hypothetical protein
VQKRGVILGGWYLPAAVKPPREAEQKFFGSFFQKRTFLLIGL